MSLFRLIQKDHGKTWITAMSAIAFLCLTFPGLAFANVTRVMDAGGAIESPSGQEFTGELESIPLQFTKGGEVDKTSLSFSALKSIRDGSELDLGPLSHDQLAPVLEAFLDQFVLGYPRLPTPDRRGFKAYVRALFPDALVLRLATPIIRPPDEIEYLASLLYSGSKFKALFHDVIERQMAIATLLGIYQDVKSYGGMQNPVVQGIFHAKMSHALVTLILGMDQIGNFPEREEITDSGVRNEFADLQRDMISGFAKSLARNANSESLSFLRHSLDLAREDLQYSNSLKRISEDMLTGHPQVWGNHPLEQDNNLRMILMARTFYGALGADIKPDLCPIVFEVAPSAP